MTESVRKIECGLIEYSDSIKLRWNR